MGNPVRAWRAWAIGMLAVAAAALATAAAGSPAPPAPEDGTLLRAEARAPLRPFESLDEFGRGYFPRRVYEEARSQKAFDILDISYASTGAGGSTVPGVLIRPKKPGRGRWPAIVYNRGGTGDFGRIDDLAVVEMYLLAKAGFVVLASDYRFHGEMSKRDECGGLDVDDVMRLLLLLRSQAGVNASRLFMLGVSRGGAMTYMALKRGAPAAALELAGGRYDVQLYLNDGHSLPRHRDDRNRRIVAWFNSAASK